jgi:hypothetical protein
MTTANRKTTSKATTSKGSTTIDKAERIRELYAQILVELTELNELWARHA